MYHVLYNYRVGKKTMSKCQLTEEFTRKVRALLYYVYTTTYNWINIKWPCIFIVKFYRIIQFPKQRRFGASLYFRVSYSVHPVTYTIQLFRNKPSHKLYRCMSVRSTQHHTLLHNLTIIHTKTFFSPACHPCQIYQYMSAHSTRHHTFLHNPMVLHTKKFSRQTFTRARNYRPLQNTFQTHIRVGTFTFSLL